MCVMPSAFAIDTAMTRPRALNEPVGRRPSSLTRNSPPPSVAPSAAAARSASRLAEADDVFRSAHRQELAIAPQIGRSRCAACPCSAPCARPQDRSAQQRLAGARQVVDLVGLVALAGQRAFEMRDKARELRPSDCRRTAWKRLPVVSRHSGVAGARNTTKMRERKIDDKADRDRGHFRGPGRNEKELDQAPHGSGVGEETA